MTKNKELNMDWVDRKFKLLELEAPPKMFNGVNLVGGTKESIKKDIALLFEAKDKEFREILNGLENQVEIDMGRADMSLRQLKESRGYLKFALDNIDKALKETND